MAERTRTPGPWEVEELDGYITGRIIGPHGLLVVGDTVVGRGVQRQVDADLIAAAPRLLDSLLAVEWGGSVLDDEVGDEIDCCPNCGARVSPEIEDGQGQAFHYAHCELRDSLDAALGVKSPRRVHPAHAGRASRV